MQTDNQRFKILLHDARVICLNKLQMVQAKFGASQADLTALAKEMDTTTGHFNNPVLWMNPIPFEEAEIMDYVLKIDSSDPADLPGFLGLMRQFIAYLEDKVLKAPLESALAITVSDFNLKVLDALLIAQRNIAGRKVFFRNQGTDLDTHADFIPLQQAQTSVLVSYRKALNENTVQSTESDVIIFDRIAEGIKKSDVLTKFFDFYKMLTSTMKSKLPAATAQA